MTFAEARARVIELGKLPRGWDGYGAEPPNEIAVANALKALDILEAMGCRGPEAVEPTR